MFTAKAPHGRQAAGIRHGRVPSAEFPLNYSYVCVISNNKVKLTGNLQVAEHGAKSLWGFVLFVDTKGVFVQKFVSLVFKFRSR
jgi:hypothetical protein